MPDDHRHEDTLAAAAGAAKADALAAMTQLAGDTSACAMARDGRSFPAYKFHEGRMVAMSQLLRRLREPGGDEQSALEAELADWEDAVRRAGERGRDWQAYAEGGREALLGLRS